MSCVTMHLCITGLQPHHFVTFEGVQNSAFNWKFAAACCRNIPLFREDAARLPPCFWKGCNLLFNLRAEVAAKPSEGWQGIARSGVVVQRKVQRNLRIVICLRPIGPGCAGLVLDSSTPALSRPRRMLSPICASDTLSQFSRVVHLLLLTSRVAISR